MTLATDILLIEDEAGVMDVMLRVLQRAGFTEPVVDSELLTVEYPDDRPADIKGEADGFIRSVRQNLGRRRLTPPTSTAAF